MGEEAGKNIDTGLNNTYVGQQVGTNADNEDFTIRIGDASADGFGSEPASSVVSGTTPSLLAGTLL